MTSDRFDPFENLRVSAQTNSGHLALVTSHEAITYGDLAEAAERWLDLFLNDLGLQPGDRVLMDYRSTWLVVPVYLAALRAGLLLSIRVESSVECIEGQSVDPSIVITEDLRTGLWPESVKLVPWQLPQVAHGGQRDPRDRTVSPTVPFFEYGHSPNFGWTKAASHSAFHLGQWVQFLSETLKLRALVLVLQAGNAFELEFPLWLVALSQGGTVYLDDEMTLASCSRLLGQVTVTALGGALHRVACLGDEGLDRSFGLGFRNLVTVGEDTPPVGAMKARLKAAGASWHNFYGYPEIQMVTGVVEPVAELERPRHVGKASSGNHAVVVDRAGNLCPQGIVGRLHYSGPGLAGHSIPGENYGYDTGILARNLGDNRIEVTGRHDDLVVAAGRRLAFSDIRAGLLAQPMVREVAVTRAGGSTGQAHLRVYVASDEGPALEVPHIPAQVFDVPNLPRNVDGAVDVHKLDGHDLIECRVVSDFSHALGSLPGVEGMALFARNDPTTPGLFHKNRLLAPHWLSGKSVGGSGSQTTVSDRPVAPSGLPSLVWGGEEDSRTDRPRVLADILRGAMVQSDLASRGLTYIDLDGTETSWDYSALAREAQKVLGGLRGLGLAAGDKLLLLFDRTDDFLIAFWACTFAGVVPVPCGIPKSIGDRNNETATLNNIWELLGQPYLLTSAGQAAGLGSWVDLFGFDMGKVKSLEGLRQCSEDSKWHQAQPSDTAILVFTSGSTGKPKGVVQTHAGIVAEVIGMSDKLRMASSDISVNWMPIEHIAGLNMAHLQPLYHRCRQIHTRPEFILTDPLRWLDLMSRFSATYTWAPNFAYGLINERLEKGGQIPLWNLGTVRYFLSGGEAVNAKTSQKFLSNLARFGLRPDVLIPIWGMAETCSGTIFSEVFHRDSDAGIQRLDKGSLGGRVRPSTSLEEQVTFVEIGIPIPGLSMRILGPDQTVLQEGHVGRIQVKGSMVTPGYYQNDELNSEQFSGDGWFETGDLGFILQGRLTISGRAKDIIIINGINYNANEIEALVEEVPGVMVSFTSACAVRTEDNDTDTLVVFFVSERPSLGEVVPQIHEIQQKLLGKTGIHVRHVIPVRTADIPKTSLGKIQRLKLAKSFQEGDFSEVVEQLDLFQENDSTVTEWFYEVIDVPKRLEPPRRGTRIRSVALVSAGSNSDRLLAAALSEHGVKVQLLVHTPGGPTSFEGFDLTDPGGWNALAQTWAGEGRNHDVLLATFFCRPEGCSECLEDFSAAFDLGMTAVQNLVNAFGRTGSSFGRLLFLDSLSGESAMRRRAPTPGMVLTGLVRTLREEHPEFNASLVRLGSFGTEGALDAIWTELNGHSRDDEVFLGPSGRWVQGLRRVSLADLRVDAPEDLEGGVCVVAGGLGGVGAAVCQWLLQNFRVKLVVLGRTAVAPATASSAPRTERERTFDDLDALSKDWLYFPCDLADSGFVDPLREAVRTKWGRPIAAVFHLAGELYALDDLETMGEHALQRETLAEFQRLFQAKVSGTQNLHDLVEDQPDAWMVHFSSTIGYFGGANFGAYAAANSVLDALALDRRCRGYPRTMTINWSLWDRMGMTKDYPGSLMHLMERKGFAAISVAKGLLSLAVALTLNRPQLLVGLREEVGKIKGRVYGWDRLEPRLEVYYAQRDEAGSTSDVEGLARVLLSDRKIRAAVSVSRLEAWPLGGKALPASRLKELGSRRKSAQAPVRPQSADEAAIWELWSQVLAYPAPAGSDHFFERGGSSLHLIQFVGLLNKAGYDVGMTEVFSAPVLADFCRTILARKGAERTKVTTEEAQVKLAAWSHGSARILPARGHLGAEVIYILSDVAPEAVPGLMGRIQREFPKDLLPHHVFITNDQDFQSLNGPEAQKVIDRLLDSQPVGLTDSSCESFGRTAWSAHRDQLLAFPTVGEFPMSAIQRRHALESHRRSGTQISIEGLVDGEALRSGLVSLYRNQQMLRSTLEASPSPGHWVEHRLGDEFSFPILDMRGYRRDEAERLLAIALDSYECALFDEAGPVRHGILIARFSWREWRVHLPFDHLCFDAASAEIVRRDLPLLCDLHSGITRNSMNPAPNYSSYVELLAQGPLCDDGTLAQVYQLPVFSQLSALQASELQTRRSGSSLVLLRELAWSDLLLESYSEAALSTAYRLFGNLVCDLLGRSQIAHYLVHYGRAYGDASYFDTVGEFLDLIPALYDAEQAEFSVPDLVRRTTFARDHRVNFMTLALEGTLATSFPSVQFLTNRGPQAFDNLVYFNFTGLSVPDEDQFRIQMDRFLADRDPRTQESTGITIDCYGSSRHLYVMITTGLDIDLSDLQTKFDQAVCSLGSIEKSSDLGK